MLLDKGKPVDPDGIAEDSGYFGRHHERGPKDHE